MNTNSQQLETIDIPLSKLLTWEGNVRTQTSEAGIKELAASIASVGLLQSIVVQKAQKGKYSVIAGRRRLLALSQLMDDGKVSSRFPVPCRLASTDSNLTEISLAENIFHEPMTVVQEILAFRRWVKEGKSATDIAISCGTSEAVVNRRLALADVSPVLLEKCESGEISLAILQAFTLTSDHAAQEALWEQLPRWDRKPETIRALLSHGDPPPISASGSSDSTLMKLKAVPSAAISLPKARTAHGFVTRPCSSALLPPNWKPLPPGSKRKAGNGLPLNRTPIINFSHNSAAWLPHPFPCQPPRKRSWRSWKRRPRNSRKRLTRRKTMMSAT